MVIGDHNAVFVCCMVLADRFSCLLYDEHMFVVCLLIDEHIFDIYHYLDIGGWLRCITRDAVGSPDSISTKDLMEKLVNCYYLLAS